MPVGWRTSGCSGALSGGAALCGGDGRHEAALVEVVAEVAERVQAGCGQWSSAEGAACLERGRQWLEAVWRAGCGGSALGLHVAWCEGCGQVAGAAVEAAARHVRKLSPGDVPAGCFAAAAIDTAAGWAVYGSESGRQRSDAGLEAGCVPGAAGGGRRDVEGGSGAAAVVQAALQRTAAASWAAMGVEAVVAGEGGVAACAQGSVAGLLLERARQLSSCLLQAARPACGPRLAPRRNFQLHQQLFAAVSVG